MRTSAIRQETWLSRLDFRRLAARANTTAEKPADSSRSLVVSRIDSSSSTIATSGPLGTSISRWAVESDTSARGPAKQLPVRGGGSAPADISGEEGMQALRLWYGSPTTLRWARPAG